MSNEKNKNKKKQKHKGVPLTSAHLIRGGESGKGGKGRRLRRTVADPQIASQAVTLISSFLSTWYGEMFIKTIPDWFKEILGPLATITNESMQIRFTSGTMVAISVKMDPETFVGENGMYDLINRINKRLARQQVASNLPPKRSLSFSFYTDKVVKPGREYNKLGDEYQFCIIATLPGAYNLPRLLPSIYAEYFLSIGSYAGSEPKENDAWLEQNRHLFEEFGLIDANPLLDLPVDNIFSK